MFLLFHIVRVAIILMGAVIITEPEGTSPFKARGGFSVYGPSAALALHPDRYESIQIGTYPHWKQMKPVRAIKITCQYK